MSKTNIEKIETLQEKIEQLENERKRLMNLQKEAERKARTKRLIERGAILESLVPGADKFTNEKIKAFLEKTVQGENARKILDGITAQAESTAAAKPAWATRISGVSTAEKTEVTGQGGG